MTSIPRRVNQNFRAGTETAKTLTAILPLIGGTPAACLPTCEPLSANATIEMKADSYGPLTIWGEPGANAAAPDGTPRLIEGFVTFFCISPVSHKLYSLSYNPRRGCYGCNCEAGRKAKYLPLEDTESRCWHLYEFNRQWLPGIMEARRAPKPAPARTPDGFRQLEDFRHDATGRYIPPPPVSAATYAADWG